MDPAQRRFFAKNGYLVIPAALAPSHVASLDRLISSRLRNELAPGELFVDGYQKCRLGPCLQPGVPQAAALKAPGKQPAYAPPPGWAETLERQPGEPAGQRSAGWLAPGAWPAVPG